MRVALVERKLIGGTCVNAGCTPTKTLAASAHAAHIVRRAADFGIDTLPPTANMARVRTRMRQVVSASGEGLERWLEGMEGLTLLRGHARFVAPDTLEVAGIRLSAPRIFLNVGARPSRPDLPGVRDVPYLTSTTILDLDRLPRHLVVVGGSYIGLEFAQMYRRFGAEVTVVERASALLQREDPEISEAIRGILAAEGVAIRTAAKCIALAPGPDGVCVHVGCEEGAPEIHGSDVLLAVGRAPNTDDLSLEAAGLEVDARGFVPVNERLETAVPGIWALGDCNGRGAFTHTSWDDHEIVAANLLDGGDRNIGDRVPGYALYIDPPLGRAGLTEAQARASGYDVRVASRPMSRVGRAVEKGEAQGLMKLVVDAKSGLILGGSVLGPGGDEAIHGILYLMNAGAPAEVLGRSMPIHPTVSELLPTLVGELG
ncbi:Pyruvate/2-oxoglutarate dehydrogenase complex, dihydrolipoamide dehydrogenase (E3) component [Roseivivax sediminis]|uniref:Pyruvate/2-oxoglutarate dehydrogenase complex, dihydrolipoamide dehydrogenase (E3) component n=2 Tax=Roseivivax sediminis TaxID=936889 RepID=A0A1I1SW96_9RHOB|nr:Pyruvate/2-oxoglutarate dehydrogenase complex, dihydrolipoamide dehydrogenase (E3) component [Roseivivax sediminis]